MMFFLERNWKICFLKKLFTKFLHGFRKKKCLIFPAEKRHLGQEMGIYKFEECKYKG